MAEQVTVLELIGDAVVDNVYLSAPKAALAGAVAGGTIQAQVIPTPVPGLSFLFLGGDGNVALEVQELTGDASADELYVVTPKDILGALAVPGTVLEGFVVSNNGVSALVLQLVS